MAIFDSNVWKALEDTMPEEEYENYMYMGTESKDSLTVYLYKNISTRRYLFIDSNGRFYKKIEPKVVFIFNEVFFKEITKQEALELVNR